MASRKHIPRGCRTSYIAGLTDQSKTLYEACQEQYRCNPLCDGTIDAGNKLIELMREQKKERWEEMITSIYLTHDSRKAWKTIKSSKRHSLQAVELSQWFQAAVQIVSNLPARFTVFWACRPCGPAGWLALLLTKAGDVETNPGPTTLNKKVWICDICHKQIHVRKQISIRCNRIEHWVHLRCAGIRQAQYTDTWTCHLHR